MNDNAIRISKFLILKNLSILIVNMIIKKNKIKTLIL